MKVGDEEVDILVTEDGVRLGGSRGGSPETKIANAENKQITPAEFKAWFEGFTSALSDPSPSLIQWREVCDRVARMGVEASRHPPYVKTYGPLLRTHNESR